jgi:hypothetical protein
MIIRNKPVVYGALWLGAALFLVFFHGVELAGGKPVAALEVNLLVNAAAAWAAVWWLTATARREARAGRTPWLHLAMGFVVFGVGETLTAYFKALAPFEFRHGWVLSLVRLLGFALVITGFIIKVRRLADVSLTAVKMLIMLALAFIFGVAFWPFAWKLFTVSDIPWTGVFFIIVFPAVSFVVMEIAVYVAMTFAGGVAGRPWVALAFGIFSSAGAHLLGMYIGFVDVPWRFPLTAVAAFLSFLCYAAVAWGAWYQSAILRDRIIL